MNAPRIALAALAIAAGATLPCTGPVQAQAGPGAGYAVRLLDGQNDFGDHFAVTRFGTSDQWTGFHYVADEQALFAGSCGDGCKPETRLTSGADRGRFVSAARRSALTQRPFAAFYNATSGDLEAADCVDSSCSFATLRVLDTVNDVGVGTATAIDPSSGFPHVAYYDASNGDLRLYRCTSATCDTGNNLVVDGVGNRGRNPAIAFASGLLWIAYDDTTSGELRLARAAAPFGAADFQSFPIGPGGTGAITVDGSGFIDLVFRGGASNTLERLHCQNAACSTAAQSTLDSAGRGFAPSATRLPNGNLLVSHQEQAAGTMRATVCNDDACSSPQRLVLDVGPGFGPTSVAMAYSVGRPLIQYQDAQRTEVRSTQCTTLACTAFVRRVANGIPAFAPDLALRADGRPVAIWTKLRLPRIGICADTLCSSVTYRTPDGANSDASRPAIAVRPDGRPFAYFSYVGGTAAWDCADADCSAGALRQVSGTGNSTSNITELALRADGRPLMLYYRSSTNDVFLFSCADVNCTSGTERLVVDEPTTQSTTLAGLALAIGTDGRPQVAYNLSNQPTPGNFAGALRLARCADVECTSASVRSLNAAQGFFAPPLAVRSDNRPLLVEAAGNDRNLLTCDDADCTGAARVLLPNPFDIPGRLALRSGNLPVFASGTINLGGYWACADAACTAPELTTTIADFGSSGRGFTGPLALNASGQPVMVFGEQELADVWLSVPLPDAVFGNGFEN
jgi:hypothetical protein